MRTSIFLMTMVLIPVLFLAACAGAEEVTPESLVPDGASLIGKIQLATIIEDEDLAGLYAKVPKQDDDPQNLDALLGQFTEETGVDLHQLSGVVYFADLTRGEEADKGHFGLIAQGSFEESAIVAAVEQASDGPLATGEYKERKIHTNEEENVAFSLLETGMLVLGTRSAVESVIDVHEGDPERASGKVYDTFIGMKDTLVRLALKAPTEATEQLELPLGEFPFNLDLLQEIDIVQLAVDKDAGALTVQVGADFTSESAAAEAGEVLDALLTLIKAASPDEETTRLLDDLMVSTDKARLTIKFEASVSEMEELVAGLDEGLTGRLSSPPSLEELRERQEAVPQRDVSSTAVPQAVPPTVVAPAAPQRDVAATAIAPEATATTAFVVGIRYPVMDDSDHIPVGESATYTTSPPTSGPHWPAVAQCGFYDEELPDELIVHNLEHGNVVISYNLPNPADVERLRQVVEEISIFNDWVVVRSYSKMRRGIVSMTAWGVIEDRGAGVDAQRIERFARAYSGNNLSDEARQHGPIPCR